MNLLLDTHALLWFISGDKKLPSKIVKQLVSEKSKCYVSIASLWEIAIKHSLNKLEIKGGFATIEDFFLNNDVQVLAIDFNHLNYLVKLDYHHHDPFDRIIISQAITEKMTLVSKDKFFKQYKVKLLW